MSWPIVYIYMVTIPKKMASNIRVSYALSLPAPPYVTPLLELGTNDPLCGRVSSPLSLSLCVRVRVCVCYARQAHPAAGDAYPARAGADEGGRRDRACRVRAEYCTYKSSTAVSLACRCETGMYVCAYSLYRAVVLVHVHITCTWYACACIQQYTAVYSSTELLYSYIYWRNG